MSLNNRCSFCGAELPEAKEFCVDCGARTPMKGGEEKREQEEQGSPVGEQVREDVLDRASGEGERVLGLGGGPSAIVGKRSLEASLPASVSSAPKVETIHYIPSLWLRIGAALLDQVICGGIVVVFWIGVAVIALDWSASGPSFLESGLIVLNIFWICSLLFYIIYQAEWVRRKGGTPGKLAFGLRVLDISGEPLSAGGAWARSSFSILGSVFSGGLLSMIDTGWATSNPDRRCLHDYIAGSVVVLSESKSKVDNSL